MRTLGDRATRRRLSRHDDDDDHDDHDFNQHDDARRVEHATLLWHVFVDVVVRFERVDVDHERVRGWNHDDNQHDDQYDDDDNHDDQYNDGRPVRATDDDHDDNQHDHDHDFDHVDQHDDPGPVRLHVPDRVRRC